MNNAAAVRTSEKEIIRRHLSSFLQNDLEGVVADYTAESILVTREAVYRGAEEIKGFFSQLMVHFPTQYSRFELDEFVVIDGVGFIIWHAVTPSVNVSLGTDTFMMKEGKIHRQTFAGEMHFTEQ